MKLLLYVACTVFVNNIESYYLYSISNLYCIWYPLNSIYMKIYFLSGMRVHWEGIQHAGPSGWQEAYQCVEGQYKL